MIKNLKYDNANIYKDTVMESIYCIKRAGADIIFSYFSKEVAEWLR
jgi:delta-aminolevulinic acid dehydratase/porphobilinogen synthase